MIVGHRVENTMPSEYIIQNDNWASTPRLAFIVLIVVRVGAGLGGRGPFSIVWQLICQTVCQHMAVLTSCPPHKHYKMEISKPIHGKTRFLVPRLFHICPSQPTGFCKTRPQEPNILIPICFFTHQNYANMASRRQNTIPTYNNHPTGQPGDY